MANADIAATFEQIADLLEFQGANSFRVRAYRNGARAIRDLPESVAQIVGSADRQLTDVEGIGKDLAAKITTLVQTGSLPLLDELLAQIPESVLAILRVPGLGPKRAAVLYNELGVSNLDQLRRACQSQQVRNLAGFGAKTEQKILEGIEIAGEADRRTLWFRADAVVQALGGYLQECAAVRQVEAAGSYRRGRETVGDLDFLIVADNVEAAMDHFGRFESVDRVLLRGETKMSVRLAGGMNVDLRAVPEESFGAALQYFTGSKDHNIVLRGMAKARGLKINEYGVFRGQRWVAGRTEEEVYATLDLPCFPPELREARREFEWAKAGSLPELVELEDIRGDLHMHTNSSDGLATIQQMAEAARARGLKYVAITDHSKRVAMANGLDARRLRRQWTEIDKINGQLKGLKILKGIEVDILQRGGLDLDDRVLAEADWVVASVHYGQNQSRDRITNQNRAGGSALDGRKHLSPADRRGLVHQDLSERSGPPKTISRQPHSIPSGSHGLRFYHKGCPDTTGSDLHRGVDIPQHDDIRSSMTRPWGSS